MSQTRVSDSAPVKNSLVPAIVQASTWCVDSGCNFMKFVVGCFVPSALPYLEISEIELQISINELRYQKLN